MPHLALRNADDVRALNLSPSGFAMTDSQIDHAAAATSGVSWLIALPSRPAECVDEPMWQLARQLRLDHPPAREGCERCGGSYPCRGRRLADIGLATAVGHFGVGSRSWMAYARVLAMHYRSVR